MSMTASLARFFGVEFGDVADADLDRQVGEKPKGVPHTNCSLGSIIDLECNGIRCRAVVDEIEFDREENPSDMAGIFTADRPRAYAVYSRPEVMIVLRLRAIPPGMEEA